MTEQQTTPGTCSLLTEEVANRLKKLPYVNPNPVMIIDRGGIIRFGNAACSDFFTKIQCSTDTPIPTAWRKAFSRTLSSHEEVTVQHAIGGKVYAVTMFSDNDSPPMVFGYARDITAQVRAQALLEVQAHYDMSAQMYNKSTFVRRLEKAEAPGSLLYLSYEGFDELNLKFGFGSDEKVLQYLAARLSQSLPEETISSYLGNGTFAFFLPNMPVGEAFTYSTDTLIPQVKSPAIIGSHRFFLDSRVVVISRDGEHSPHVLLEKAEAGCHVASEYRLPALVYDDNDEKILQYHADMQTVEQIEWAQEHDQFLLLRHDIHDSFAALSGDYFEVLSRMYDRHGHLVPPGLFIPIAEKKDRIVALDKYLLQQFCREYQQVYRNHPQQLACASLNLSARTFTHPDIIDFIEETIDAAGIDHERICFELLESKRIDLEVAKNTITRLKATGFQVALDDLGSGTSTYERVKEIGHLIDKVKIDRAVVCNLQEQDVRLRHSAKWFIKSILSVAEVHGFSVVCEYAENERIVNSLKNLEVPFMQGYYFSTPYPLLPGRNRNKATEANQEGPS